MEKVIVRREGNWSKSRLGFSGLIFAVTGGKEAGNKVSVWLQSTVSRATSHTAPQSREFGGEREKRQNAVRRSYYRAN